MTDVKTKIIYLLLYKKTDVSVKIWPSSVHRQYIDNKELQTSFLIKNAKSLVKEILI